MGDEVEKEAANAAAEQQAQFDLAKAQAVRLATFEFIGENRDEIVKRARAMLVAAGYTVQDKDME